jgi:hypothetical protein
MARWVNLSFLLVLLPSCVAQEARTISPSLTGTIMGAVLTHAHASGSLVYSGRCENNGGTFDLPSLKLPADRNTPPLQMLQEMFAYHPKMQVTQDANGNIRMVETDVPRDLLDLRIVQVSFSSGSHVLNNGNEALLQIMDTPDVKNYMTVNKIGPMVPGFRLFIGPSSPDAPHISGDLYYLTVSEALDYILKTYPGFWAYESCESGDKGRTVHFDFFPTVPDSVAKFP